MTTAQMKKPQAREKKKNEELKRMRLKKPPYPQT
jgi:hypothetical protein